MTEAERLDRDDPLSHFRERFVVAEPDLIYLDGNSLGRLPEQTYERLTDGVESQWGKRLVRGWGEGWIQAPLRIGEKIGKLIGAKSGETLVCDSTSVNFFKLVTGALRANPDRTKVLTDDMNFPSDLYLLQGAVDVLGGRHEIVVAQSGDGIHEAPILDLIDSNTALVTLSHTVFKSGFVYDMERITARAHEVGALVLWDLSHSVGALPIEVTRCGVDLAVGCTYKYLNGGPGSPAFLYVRQDLFESIGSPIWGWFGQKNAFAFGLDYDPAAGISRFATGTPPILSMLAIEPGVDMILEAGIDLIRSKSIAMTEFLIRQWEQKLASNGVRLNSPVKANLRGSHVSFGHPEGMRVDRALIEDMNVVPDFRQPDNIRFGLAPLYNSFRDIEIAVDRFARVLNERIYEKYPLQPPAVT